MKLPEDQIRYVDLPEVSETFADSIGLVTFDGQTARIEFCVTRMDTPKPPNKPTARRYPINRLVLTPESFLNLSNQLQGIVTALEKNGVVQKIQQNIKEYKS
jgi:hypothetical protein